MSVCGVTSDEDKRKFIKEHRQKKKNQVLEKRKNNRSLDGAMKGVQESETIICNSNLFSVTFCDGAVERTVLADSGAEGNILTMCVAEQICASDNTVTMQIMSQPKLFGTAKVGIERITCTKMPTVDVELAILHAEILLLRSVSWLVTEEK